MTRAGEALRPSRGGGMRGGVAAEIEAMTAAEVDAFRSASYGAATARVIVTGRFNVAEAEQARARGLRRAARRQAARRRALPPDRA